MTTRALPITRTGLLLLGLGGAVSLRVAVGGDAVAGSMPAALAFIAALLLLPAAASWKPGRFRLSSIGIGLLGGAGLLVLPVWSHLAGPAFWVGRPADGFVLWGTTVTAIAIMEEIVLRGLLFTAAQTAFGPIAAVGVTSIAFALIHVPLYGWGVVPLDLAVGIWLGGLRLVSGGVTAPAIAHTVADLAVWWLL